MTKKNTSMRKTAGLIKIWRFVRVYGLLRTVYKIAGRLRRPVPLVWRRHRHPDIALIGCGQYGFATLGYFLSRRFGRRLRWCYDTNFDNARSTAKTLGVAGIAETPEAAIDDPDTEYVYIASNHASHTDYAIRSLAAGKIVFVEKPISVDWDQLGRLHRAARGQENRIFAGYNRPLSKFIRHLHGILPAPNGGLSLSCFVSGHVIDVDHWYRNPNEGTRVCGNAGHWIDLFLHMLAWRGNLPKEICVQIASADPSEADDNFVLTFTTDQHDIFTLMLTARTEPFEGINETINVQWGDVIAKIDDFRRMTIWRGSHLDHVRSWPKDVGHQTSALQPFHPAFARAWSEVIASSVVMLHVTDMVRAGENRRVLSLVQDIHKLDNEALSE
jgi:predicted dehydrogenase